MANSYRLLCGMRIPLLVAFAACFWRGSETVAVNYLEQIHLEPSRGLLLEGDAFNLTCWANTSVAFKQLCKGNNTETVSITWRRKPLLSGLERNETAVWVHVESAPAKHAAGERYECVCRNQTLVADSFEVDLQLQAEEFSCRFVDSEWQPPLFCSFAKPPGIDSDTANPRLALHFAGSAYACHELEGNGTRMNCSIPGTKFDKFKDDIELSLRLNDRQTKRFNLSRAEYVILAPPLQEALQLFNVTDDGACLSWKDTKYTNHYPVKFDWSLQLAPNVSHSFHWLSPAVGSQRALCLAALPYAYHNYTLQLRHRYPNPKALWSLAGQVSFLTAARRPRRPPTMWPSGYHIDPYNSSELYVYWRGLDPLEQDGSDFGYEVSVLSAVDNSLVGHLNVVVQPNMTIIGGLSPTRNSYRIVVRSRNVVGASANSSELIIPRLEEPENRRPQNLHIPKQRQELHWTAPKEQDHLVGYTVYWCSANVTYGNKCRDPLSIQSERIDASRTQYDSSAVHSFLWAVSADYNVTAGGGSGGLAWMQLQNAGAAAATINDYMRHIQGIVALIILGLFIYVSVRKYKRMSRIEVVLPAGVQQQQQQQELQQLLLEKRRAQQEPLELGRRRRLSSEEIPLVLHGNFKPLNLLVPNEHITKQKAPPTPTPTPTARPLSLSPSPPPTIAINPLKQLPASCYVSMQPVTSLDYVTPSGGFR